MFVPGMPIVVNRNTHQGLKLVNGDSFEVLDVILDKAYPGYRINANTLRPAGRDPAGGGVNERLPLRGHAARCHPPDTNQHENRVPEEAAVAKNRRHPQGTTMCGRIRLHGLQSARQKDRVALELRGTRTMNHDGQAVPTQCDPYSLYVQLSRSRSLDGITLISNAREMDFIGNKVPENMNI
jgi:hypothetical protein